MEAFRDQLNLPRFEIHPNERLVTGVLPIGPEGKVDMRLYPSRRPAAVQIRDEVISLEQGKLKYAMLAAVSGAGKTSVAFDLASQFFTIYFVCIPSNENPRSSKYDPSTFPILQEEVKDCINSNKDKRGMTNEARRIATVLLTCHLFALYHFLDKFPAGTPYQFLMFH